jgi:anthraniloyl-CoA monooxygenase
VHYGARATGGAGLVYTEMTCTSPDARISPGCTGLWNEEQAAAWARIVSFVHEHSPARICLQLGHAGRKGATQLGWERMDHPLPAGRWPIIAPSAIPYLEGVSELPREMTRADMDRVRDDFVRAAELGAGAGFDMLELHMAHGYLLASFLSPLTNHRPDGYGGDVLGRLGFPLEVLAAVRRAWPAERPLSVRVSATDWAPGGTCEEDILAIARALRDEGADLINVSTGQTVSWQSPVYGRMWQAPFSDLIRNVVRVPTMTAGNIFEADHVNSIVAAGRADLCALARPHLVNAAWTLTAAAEQRHEGQWWPRQYLQGRTQLERNLDHASILARSV